MRVHRVIVLGLLISIGTAPVWARGWIEPALPAILVESSWLAEQLYHQNLVILDTGRTEAAYRSGHIPGAVHLPQSLYLAEVDGIPAMFPGVERVEAALRNAGVNNNSVVVIYDADTGLWATRLFWTLELLGHKNVALLNGGIGKWKADGLALGTDVTKPTAGDFQADFQKPLVLSGSELAELLDSGDIIVIDARSRAEFEGVDVRAARGGHIPGSINIDWVLNNIGDAVDTFLPVDDLREFYASRLVDDGGRKITLCQTGVRGAHTYFVLRLLGYTDVALYDGSWIEWGNNELFPVATGTH